MTFNAPWSKAEASTTIPIKDANGKTVASVKYGEGDDSIATLISAAPELLAALERISNLTTRADLGGTAYIIEINRADEQARSAIAKAKGE